MPGGFRDGRVLAAKKLKRGSELEPVQLQRAVNTLFRLKPELQNHYKFL